MGSQPKVIWRRVLLGCGLVCAAFAVLIAAGLFWEGGLDLPKFWPGDWVRWVLVIGLALVAVLAFLVREFKQIKDVVVGTFVWGATALSYFAVGALVLGEKTGPVMGLADSEAQARGLGVVTVIFFLIAAVLVLKAEQGKTEPTVSLTSIMSLRTSTGSTVILLWSLVVTYALGIIAGTVIQAGGGDRAFECQNPTTDQNCVQKGVWPSYLILLAVPGAAAAAVKMSVDKENRTSAQLAARTLRGAKIRAENKLIDVRASRDPNDQAEEAALERSRQFLDEASLAADPGDATATTTAISDIQYFVFNVFAMLFVLSSLIPSGRLLEVPELLLALTGASALVYTVNRHTTT